MRGERGLAVRLGKILELEEQRVRRLGAQRVTMHCKLVFDRDHSWLDPAYQTREAG